ncbi:terminase gpA endonuclease subunit [Pirellula sp. SH-Sr6A]|uniref:terminase gpA endonuclease subunit n=1 Tax=Pirellula sp. SH-Sr6A TaxID=1632865 RepID=UPI0039657D6E
MDTGVNEGLTDPDEIPAPPDEAITKPGDLWILGNHRLLCGDSSSPADLDRLLAGNAIHLCNTDPPYNVKVEPRSNNAIAAGLSSFSNDAASGKLKQGQGNAASFGVDHETGKPKHAATHKKLRPKDRPLANDFVSDGEFDRLLDAWFGNIARVLLPGRCFYIWGGYANLGNYPPFLSRHALYFSQSIVWDKQHPVLTRKDFMGAFELAFYGWKEGAGHKYYGPNNATDLWQVKKVNPQSMIHLTEKPVELAVRAMQYQFCRQSQFAGIVMPSHGRFVGASSQPFSEYKRKPGDRVGHNWRIPNVHGKRVVRHVVYDTNFWKTFVHARLAVAMGDRGCLSLFGDTPDTHRLLAEHLSAEYHVRTEGRGRIVDEWKQRPERGDNHWFDCVVGCAVAASMQGVSLPDAGNTIAKKQGRVSFAELQRRRGR